MSTTAAPMTAPENVPATDGEIAELEGFEAVGRMAASDRAILKRILARIKAEREAREKAERRLRDEVEYRISLGNDLIRQRDEAQKDQIEIRELLGCTEDEDDYIGTLRSLLATARRNRMARRNQ